MLQLSRFSPLRSKFAIIAVFSSMLFSVYTVTCESDSQTINSKITKYPLLDYVQVYVTPSPYVPKMLTIKQNQPVEIGFVIYNVNNYTLYNVRIYNFSSLNVPLTLNVTGKIDRLLPNETATIKAVLSTDSRFNLTGHAAMAWTVLAENETKATMETTTLFKDIAVIRPENKYDLTLSAVYFTQYTVFVNSASCTLRIPPEKGSSNVSVNVSNFPYRTVTSTILFQESINGVTESIHVVKVTVQPSQTKLVTFRWHPEQSGVPHFDVLALTDLNVPSLMAVENSGDAQVC